MPGWGLPGFLPYSKKPHRSIKLHLLYPSGRPPRTHVPTEPGTLLANVSQGQVGVTLEPVIHHSFASPWEAALKGTALHILYAATGLLWKLWQCLGPHYSSKGIIWDKSPPLRAVSLALQKNSHSNWARDCKTEELSEVIESRSPGNRCLSSHPGSIT